MLAGSAHALRRTDAIALGIGSRVTASTLVVACVLTLVLGAASMLEALTAMDKDLQRMSANLDEANEGLVVLNQTMDSLGPTNTHMDEILLTVKDTHGEVQRAGTNVQALQGQTARINQGIKQIGTSTSGMLTSLQSLDAATGRLQGTVTSLTPQLRPLARTQGAMLADVRRMKSGMTAQNGSLGYAIRMLNYMAQPPRTNGFSVRVTLDPRSLPPIPGVEAETTPIEVFPRNPWPTYDGP